MKKQILISAISIFTLVLIAGVWTAESCAAEKPNLKFQLKSGEELFDIEDIVRFDWDKQIFELKRQSAMDLLGKQTGLYRKFTLVSGTESIYSGTLVSIESSIAFRGPVIVFDRENLDGIKPPLFKIDNGYPEALAKSDPDLRFSERLKKALQQNGVLGEIDLNNPPVPIERFSHGWFGKKDSLRVLIEVFPETFRLHRSARVHIHLTGVKYLDENHVVDVNATLVSNDSKSRFSTKKIFPSHGTGWKNIYIFEMNPWEAAGDSKTKSVKPGHAKLSVEVFTRKILDECAKTYSHPIDHVKTDPINVTILPGRPLLPELPKAITIEFQRALRQGNWKKALSFCSNKVKTKATEYESIETFFKDALPIEKVASLPEFQVSGRRTQNNKVVSYDCSIRLKYPNSKYPLHWNLSVRRKDSNWVVEFPTKPLDIWLKHENLKMKWANEERRFDEEKIRKGFDVRLVPLSENFVIGSPMLFRLEMKNISNETLGYMHTSFMVNDPMVVKNPNGSIIPYVDTSYQTVGGPEFVEPTETVVLTDKYDVRSQYHIIKPGRYGFQFKGLWWNEPSNIVEIDIKPGELSLLEGVVEALMPILPNDWTLTRTRIRDIADFDSETDRGIIVNMVGKRGRKGTSGGTVGVFILINPSQSVLEKTEHEAGLWGQSQWGPVYVKSLDAERLWPNYKEEIINAFDIQRVGDKADVQIEIDKR